MVVKTESVSSAEQRLGVQIRRARLLDDVDQKTLAGRANISLGALQNLELGKGARLSTLVRVLRVLGREQWLDTLEPEPEPGPLDLLEGRDAPAEPRRASRRSAA